MYRECWETQCFAFYPRVPNLKFSSLGSDPAINSTLYFNLEEPVSIAESLRKLIESPDLRMKSALNAYKRSKIYNWKKTADSTFEFFHDVLN